MPVGKDQLWLSTGNRIGRRVPQGPRARRGVGSTSLSPAPRGGAAPPARRGRTRPRGWVRRPDGPAHRRRSGYVGAEGGQLPWRPARQAQAGWAGVQHGKRRLPEGGARRPPPRVAEARGAAAPPRPTPRWAPPRPRPEPAERAGGAAVAPAPQVPRGPRAGAALAFAAGRAAEGLAVRVAAPRSPPPTGAAFRPSVSATAVRRRREGRGRAGRATASGAAAGTSAPTASAGLTPPPLGAGGGGRGPPSPPPPPPLGGAPSLSLPLGGGGGAASSPLGIAATGPRPAGGARDGATSSPPPGSLFEGPGGVMYDLRCAPGDPFLADVSPPVGAPPTPPHPFVEKSAPTVELLVPTGWPRTRAAMAAAPRRRTSLIMAWLPGSSR